MPSENDKTVSIHPIKKIHPKRNKNINLKVTDFLNETNQNGARSEENLISSCFIPQRSSNYVGPQKNLRQPSTDFQHSSRHNQVEWIV